MTNVYTILEAARKSFKDNDYFSAIYQLENCLNEEKGDEAFLAINVALYVVYEFRERDDLRVSVLKNLKNRSKWNIDELNVKIATEFLAYDGHINLQTKAKDNAERYCDENINAGIKTFGTYFIKACTQQDDIDNLLHFLDLSLKQEVDRIAQILGQLDQRSTFNGDKARAEKIKRWLQKFPNDLPVTRWLKARCHEEIGDIDGALELYTSLVDTKFGKLSECQLIGIYRKSGNYKKAIQLAKKRPSHDTNLLIRLYLAAGNIEDAKKLFDQKQTNHRAFDAGIFLEFGLFDEALEALSNAGNTLNTIILYNKIRAVFGKNWRKSANLNFLEIDMLPLSICGREICIQIDSSDKDTPMPQQVALFYAMEARLYFLLNIRFLKRKRKELQEIERGDNEDFFPSISNYIHRDRVGEIYKEFKDKLFRPLATLNDFRLKHYENSFDRAILLLDKAYEKIKEESETKSVLALEKKEGLTLSEMWNLYYVHFNRNNYKTSQEYLQRIEEKQPDNPKIYQEKGRIAFQLKQYDTAITYLNKAIQQFEKYTERAASAHNLLQQVYAAKIEEVDQTLEQKNININQLNHSFEAWFKADVELFTNLDDVLPIFGPRHNDSIMSLKGQTIYKYYAFNINSISALSDEKIYFSKPQQLNDPFDMDGYLETIIQKEFSNVSEEVKNKISCFCSTLQNNNLQMWAHYADSFRGICIGYKFNKLPRGIAWRKLLYPDDKRSRRALVESLFVKSKNWAYEEEIRFLKFSESPQLVTISPDKTQPAIDGHISEIVLGSRFDMNKNGPVLMAVRAQINAKYKEAGIDPIHVLQAHESSSEKSDSLIIQPISFFE